METANEEREEKMLGSATRIALLQNNRMNRDTDILLSTVQLLVCVLVATPLLFFGVRQSGGEFALTLFGRCITAQVERSEEPRSYSFTLHGRTYYGATPGRIYGFDSGDLIPVRYLPSYPQCSEIVGLRTNSGWLRLQLTAGTLLAMGAVSLFRKRRSLLRLQAANAEQERLLPPVVPPSASDTMPTV